MKSRFAGARLWQVQDLGPVCAESDTGALSGGLSLQRAGLHYTQGFQTETRNHKLLEIFVDKKSEARKKCELNCLCKSL